MLKPKAIAQALQQATGKGVESALYLCHSNHRLLTKDGSLLAHAVVPTLTPNAENDPRVNSAIMSEIWRSHATQVRAWLETSDPPSFIMLDCQVSLVIMGF